MALNPTIQERTGQISVAGGENFTISSAEPSRSMVAFSNRHNTTIIRDQRGLATAELTGSTTLRVDVFQDVDTFDFAAYIAEFGAGDGVSVQRRSGLATHTITAVDLTRSIPVIYQNHDANNLQRNRLAAAYFASSTQLVITTDSDLANDVVAEVIEFPVGVSVQYRSVTFLTSETSVNVTGLSHDPDTSIAYCTCLIAGGPRHYDQSVRYAEIVNSTTVNLRRHASGNAATVHLFVVDFGTNATVSRQALSFGASDNTKAHTLPANSGTLLPWPLGYAGCPVYGAGVDNENDNYKATFNAGKTALNVDRYLGGAASTYCSQVIDFGGAPPVTGKQFRNPNLDGIGAGGPFFADPLAA